MSLLAQSELDHAGLERTILQAAGAAAWPRTASKTGTGVSDSTALSRGWHSPAGMSYRLRAVRLPPGSLSLREAILVLVRRVGPSVPAPSQLMDAFGFTKREAEVAHRLAHGHSNQQIAADLKVSPHTVRHHAEAVFVKAGVSSRNALALHLGSVPRRFGETT